MRLFKNIPNEVVLAASKRILLVKSKDLIERFIRVFQVSDEIAGLLLKISEVQDGPKVRHWLAVTRSILRSRLMGLDPEPQFMAHFIIDSLEPKRLAELHALRGIELLIDDALISSSPLELSLNNVSPPPKLHIGKHGTIHLSNQKAGVAFEVRNDGEFRFRLGDCRISSANIAKQKEGYCFDPDVFVPTEAGTMLVASNIQGLGDVYHSNAPVIRGRAALNAWAPVLGEAVSMLHDLDAEAAIDCVELSKAICPLHCGSTSFGSSSPADVIGLVFLPGVSDTYDVAECLLHESLHQKLYHAEEGSQLFVEETGDAEIYYSPWRPDARPLRMLMHGAFVFTGVAQMWRALAEKSRDPAIRDQAHFHIHLRSGQSRRALDIVEKYGEMTSFGKTVREIISEGLRDCRNGIDLSNYYTNESEERQQKHFEMHSLFVH